ncbi:hypothetical protein B0H13DRAFT_2273195 [Mycena leptocephala]|nr:hypothetical protein B0H13DRAFT_2273195 [Mycena leptocephala]
MTLTTGMDVAAMSSEQSSTSAAQQENQARSIQLLEGTLQKIKTAITATALTTITATALPYDERAGWDDKQVCLAGTRRRHIDDVMAWVRAKDVIGSGQIYLLADVLGSGKTALAHSIAEQCSDAGVLASTFFFDRTAGRTSPRQFVYNLVRDLDQIPALSPHISRALRAEPSLTLSQPVARLFKKLVIGPVVESRVSGPLVVVIDALNEAEPGDLERIFQTQITDLPGTFRIFVTSQPLRSILHALGSEISPHDLGIHREDNRKDIANFVARRLREISSHHSLDNWPNTQVTAQLLERAEGLFLWVSTIFDYLENRVLYPEKALQRLLASMRDSALPPEKTMDRLYSAILATCYWDDTDFVEGYQQIMGTLVVQREPLTMNALQQLHSHLPRVKVILDPLASLVTGLAGIGQPVRILHGSFRDYITLRATDLSHIDTAHQSERLSILCLRTLNELFGAELPESNHLISRNPDEFPPGLGVDHLTEDQWYATKFWWSHLVELEYILPLESELAQCLSQFLSRHFLMWIEVLALKGTYRSLTPLRSWLRAARLVDYITSPEVLRALSELPRRFSEGRRHGEALLVIEDLEEAMASLHLNPYLQGEVHPSGVPYAYGDGGEDDNHMDSLHDSDSDQLLPEIRFTIQREMQTLVGTRVKRRKVLDSGTVSDQYLRDIVSLLPARHIEPESQIKKVPDSRSVSDQSSHWALVRATTDIKSSEKPRPPNAGSSTHK